jgi:hypothetical protein
LLKEKLEKCKDNENQYKNLQLLLENNKNEYEKQNEKILQYCNEINCLKDEIKTLKDINVENNNYKNEVESLKNSNIEKDIEISQFETSNKQHDEITCKFNNSQDEYKKLNMK